MAFNQKKLKLYVFVDFSSSYANDNIDQWLDKYKILTDSKKTSLILIGDTSGEGTLTYNEALAERRNESVKDYLIKGGVEESRIKLQIFDQPSQFTAHLKKRKRRTIAVFVDYKQVLTKEWNIYTTEEEQR